METYHPRSSVPTLVCSNHPTVQFGFCHNEAYLHKAGGRRSGGAGLIPVDSNLSSSAEEMLTFKPSLNLYFWASLIRIMRFHSLVTRPGGNVTFIISNMEISSRRGGSASHTCPAPATRSNLRPLALHQQSK